MDICVVFHSCDIIHSFPILEICVFLTEASLLMEINAQSIQFQTILDKIVPVNFSITTNIYPFDCTFLKILQLS